MTSKKSRIDIYRVVRSTLEQFEQRFLKQGFEEDQPHDEHRKVKFTKKCFINSHLSNEPFPVMEGNWLSKWGYTALKIEGEQYIV